MNVLGEADIKMFPCLENTEKLSSTAKELFLKQKLDFKFEYVRGTTSKFKAIILSKDLLPLTITKITKH